VVVYVLVAQRQADDALANQRPKHMHHPARITTVLEAPGEAVDQTDHPVCLPQQQRPGIRGYRPAVERRLHPAAIKPFETQLFGDTLCLHRTPLCDLIKSFSQHNFLRFLGPMHLPW
jgi:hypothetical protein